MNGTGDKWPDVAGRFTAEGHVLPVRIYYEDTDFSGRVYHASYLRFCERGRSELLRMTGASHSDLFEVGNDGGGIFFAVRRIVADYLAPAGIDDLVEVHSKFAAVSGARLTIEQLVSRGTTELMRAQVIVAALAANGRPRRLPADLAARLKPKLAMTDQNTNAEDR
ncbi:MAG: YbgC/FadM family acyl-CoA thioesterase [Rhizobiales bacterium]|nr:YbgC/FadM family acyl-CoA thioesterase [Hyphomicrobiales bacterium]